jgi:hypothetical protein
MGTIAARSNSRHSLPRFSLQAEDVPKGRVDHLEGGRILGACILLGGSPPGTG